jgi:hypothetical protein
MGDDFVLQDIRACGDGRVYTTMVGDWIVDAGKPMMHLNHSILIKFLCFNLLCLSCEDLRNGSHSVLRRRGNQKLNA